VLGICCSSLGDKPRAIVRYCQAIDRNPDGYVHRYNLALALNVRARELTMAEPAKRRDPPQTSKLSSGR
jgi:hypothetical protein